jgi:desulfoferrodoxin-like iron-binding protein
MHVCIWINPSNERKNFSMVNVSAEGQVFKCEICGNVVIVKEAGGGELICCGEPMKLESE